MGKGMVVLITGGNDNGKSEYAEDLDLKLSPNGAQAGFTRLYLATMSARDEESLKRIEKHILRRKDMEYITIEKSCNIGMIDPVSYRANDPENDEKDGHTLFEDNKTDKLDRFILLIEDIPNLLANEMFKGTDFYPDVADKIINDIKKLVSVCEHTVIVTNEVFSDGMTYDEYTTTYLCEFGKINREVAKFSDKVVELVCGIPLIIKDSEKSSALLGGQ